MNMRRLVEPETLKHVRTKYDLCRRSDQRPPGESYYTRYMSTTVIIFLTSVLYLCMYSMMMRYNSGYILIFFKISQRVYYIIGH